MKKSLKQQREEETERRRAADAKLKELERREHERLLRAGKRAGPDELWVSDEELELGLRHAVELAQRRVARAGEPDPAAGPDRNGDDGAAASYRETGSP